MDEKASPKLVNRREHRKSSFKMGRTIGEKREKLETANERAAARKKDKKKKAVRILLTVVGFLILIGLLIVLAVALIGESKPSDEGGEEQNVTVIYEPSIEVIDEDNPSGQITSRMSSYIGQAEEDFKDLGYKPVKAVIPSGAVREVDFYLEERPGFIKMIIDRGSAVSVEDADRMMRYLESIGVGQYEYIDVRIEGKAYWK